VTVIEILYGDLVSCQPSCESSGDCSFLAQRTFGVTGSSKEGRSLRGDAFVCAGRAFLRTVALEVSGDGMASLGRDVVGNHRDDFGVDIHCVVSSDLLLTLSSDSFLLFAT
jgi:hypothetical protein